MTKSALARAMQTAGVRHILQSSLVMKQHKDAHGVCIIPASQDRAAMKILAHLNRTLTDIEGSKRGDLTYNFEPSLSEEEQDALLPG